MQTINKIVMAGNIVIQNDLEETIAVFPATEQGLKALEVFKEGVAKGRVYNLYDGDTGAFLAGDLN